MSTLTTSPTLTFYQQEYSLFSTLFQNFFFFVCNLFVIEKELRQDTKENSHFLFQIQIQTFKVGMSGTEGVWWYGNQDMGQTIFQIFSDAQFPDNDVYV
jgi:hypothetical protein